MLPQHDSLPVLFKTPPLPALYHLRPFLRTSGVFVAYINEKDLRRPARTVLDIDGRDRDISPSCNIRRQPLLETRGRRGSIQNRGHYQVPSAIRIDQLPGDLNSGAIYLVGLVDEDQH